MCNNFREGFTALLTDTIDKDHRNEIENHLEGCADCRMEFDSLKKMWDLMGTVPQPEPPEAMQAGFSKVLSDYKEEISVKKNPVSDWISKLREYWSVQPQPGLAFSVLLVVAGLAGGYLLHKPGQSSIRYSRQIDSLSAQVSEIKQAVMLSLLQNPSASQRIRAVAYTDEISNVNLKVIEALFTTLNEDPNVNVRLATLEALVRLSDEPQVREGLVRSINLQDSPMMQLALADAMVKLQEKRSVKSLQMLLDKKNLNNMVKLNIEKSIQKLI